MPATRRAHARILCRNILFLLLALCPASLFAAEHVLFLYDQRSQVQQNFSRQAIRQLHGRRATLLASSLSTVAASRAEHQARLRNATLIVAIGGNAAEFIRQQQLHAGLLYTLLPQARFRKLGLADRSCPKYQCALLAIEQPLSRQLKIIRQAFGKHRTVGTIIGKYSEARQQEFDSACQLNGLTCVSERIDHAELLPILSEVLARSDIFLALPDPSVITPQSARTLLLASYQQRIPVVAFSKAFARAGALLAIYTRLDDMASQTATIVVDYLAGKRRFKQDYYPPDRAAIEVNRTVARSLDISLRHLQTDDGQDPR